MVFRVRKRTTEIMENCASSRRGMRLSTFIATSSRTLSQSGLNHMFTQGFLRLKSPRLIPVAQVKNLNVFYSYSAWILKYQIFCPNCCKMAANAPGITSLHTSSLSVKLPLRLLQKDLDSPSQLEAPASSSCHPATHLGLLQYKNKALPHAPRSCLAHTCPRVSSP